MSCRVFQSHIPFCVSFYFWMGVERDYSDAFMFSSPFFLFFPLACGVVLLFD